MKKSETVVKSYYNKANFSVTFVLGIYVDSLKAQSKHSLPLFLTALLLHDLL